MPLISRLAFVVIALTAPMLAEHRAGAFSQIVDDEGNALGQEREGIVSVPLPPLQGPGIEDIPGHQEDRSPRDRREPALPSPATPAIGGNDGTVPADRRDKISPVSDEPETDDRPKRDDAAPAPDAVTISPVSYGTEDLPDPVRRMRTNLIRIARSGELEALRPYLGKGPEGTVVSFGDPVDDPIRHLREQSGDADGAEILAILLEILQTGHVVLEPGKDNEIYVWPYFAQTRLDTLDKRQKVELFELVTAGDYAMMLDFGAYNFYRLGITPEGSVAFFVNGD